ncbi:hypothetical protein Cme02nite_54060 [Catellatospora methionotrophica]|uniref:Uncharacterized protein n=1 Tax=Catellatospora methionotrophica TaxID=121620 RepID=A0A8J3PHV8_9ACTN|nr:hypothetical protein [Catellatospora methionotrophica]GIG17074.1 hypothetical protein Cme02nite_54060 [Catellatospora methionotrophica]
MSDLNELLADIGDRARTYDVTERALAGGKRRRTRRHATLAGATGALAVAALLAAVSVPFGRPAPEPAVVVSPSPTACTVAELPTPDGVRPGSFTGLAGDPTGRILAARGEAATGAIVAIWIDGRPSTVFAVPDTVDFVAAVSSTGTLVLSGRQVKDTPGEVQYTGMAWVYEGGTLTRLKGQDVLGAGINAAGAVVGLLGWSPVVWQDAAAEPVRLPVPGGLRTGHPMAIADDGSVVAPIFQDGSARLHLWPPGGSPRPLVLPAAVDGVPVFDSAVDTIADGWISGTFLTRAGGTSYRYAARWKPDTGTIEWSAGPGRATVTNPQGWAVHQATGGLVLAREDVTVDVPGLPGYPLTAQPYAGDWPRVTVLSPDGRTLAGLQFTLAGGTPTRHVLSWTCR